MPSTSPCSTLQERGREPGALLYAGAAAQGIVAMRDDHLMAVLGSPSAADFLLSIPAIGPGPVLSRCTE
jgi:hypothetical protein